MEVTLRHMKTIQGKIFKLLPLFQNENEGLTKYIGSLIYELKGLQYYLDGQEESMLISIVSILESMYDDSIEPKPDLILIKREIFGLTNLMDKIIECGDYE